MEAQINEIMRSLGRIEQKADSTVSSLAEMKDWVKGHEGRISSIENANATSAGRLGALQLAWSGIVSAAVALVAAYVGRR